MLQSLRCGREAGPACRQLGDFLAYWLRRSLAEKYDTSDAVGATRERSLICLPLRH